MRIFPDKSCREYEHTYFTFIDFLRKSCRLWAKVEKLCRARQVTDDTTIRRMRSACWTTRATNTRSEYVTLIVFPRQKWLRECT